MEKKILNIGSVTKDIIITPTEEYSQIGGAVYYQWNTLNQLKVPNESIILIGENDVEMIDSINKNNSIHPIITNKSMQYTNIYSKDNTRSQKAYFPKDKITPENIEKLPINLNEYKKVILSPLSPYEITKELMEYLKKSENEITMLIQGFTRKLDNNSNVQKTRWTDYEKYMKYTDIISSDEDEFKTAFDIEPTDENVNKFIRDNKLKMVIITQGIDGSTIYTSNKKIKIPSVKTDKEIDFTGLGDTYISAFIAKKDKTTPFNAGLYAAIVAKNKLENKGPLKTSKNNIEKEYEFRLNQISQYDKWNNNG